MIAAAQSRHPLATHPEFSPRLRALFNLQPGHLAAQSWYINSPAKCGRNHWHRYINIQITAITFKNRVIRYIHKNIQIARWRAAQTCLALARQTDACAGIHACRNIYRQIFRFFDPALPATWTTGVRDSLACPLASRTGALYSEEPLLGAHLAHTAASGTGNRLAALGGSASPATVTGRRYIGHNIFLAACIGLIQINGQIIA